MPELPESTLNELLAEPIIRQLMASDGVKPDEIRRLMARAGRTAAPAAERHERRLHALKMPPNWLYRPGAADCGLCAPK